MEYISASRLHLFNQCPQSFQLQYLEGIRDLDETTDWYANYGTLYHSIAEGIAKKEILSLDQAIQKFDKEFPACLVPDKNKADYYQQGKKGIEQTFKELQDIKVIGVEMEFKLYIDFSLPPLYGFIDLVYRDKNGKLVVRDYKTSKVYKKADMNKQYQPYIYPLAAEQVLGETPDYFEFDFVRFQEQKQVIVNDNHIRMGKIKIKGKWKEIQSGKFPAKYSPFFCQNFCSVRSICPLYLKKNGG